MLSRCTDSTPEFADTRADGPAPLPARQVRRGGMVRIGDFLWCAAVVVTVLWAVPGSAQTIYRSTMPDGRVIFGDKPVAGAEQVEPIDTSSRPTNVVPSGTRNQDAAQQRDLQRQQQAARQAEVREAEQVLRAAESAQAAGKEPLPGERLGNAGGGSRLTDAYWERQTALKAAVTEARTRLDAARRAAR